jgi:exopolysaccharide production protein ExoZ
MAVHTAQNMPQLHTPLKELAASGRYGVQLFFIVSAMTLTLSWHARSDSSYPFYIRRFFRIAPMFWLAIIFYCFHYGLGPRLFAPDGISWQEIGLTFTFLHGWYPASISSVVPGGWSIAVEMTFYVIFPALAVILKDLRRVRFAILISFILGMVINRLAVTAIPLLASGQSVQLASYFKEFWFFNQFPVFLLGIHVYYSLQEEKASKELLNNLLAGCFIAIIVLPYFKVFPAHLQYGTCFAILTFCLASGAGRFLVNRLICQLGKLSYSCYLLHFAVIELLRSNGVLSASNMPFGGLLAPDLFYLMMLPLVVAITAALATISYNGVEQPMIALGNRLARALVKANTNTAKSSLTMANDARL